jgi:RecA/RadA recombinase
MTEQASTATTTAAATNRMQDNPALAKRALRADIGGKWGKFTEQELTDLKDNDDLVTQLVAKYGLEKDAAQRDAAAVVNGRAF